MKTDPGKALSKMQKFCCWRDRCTSEVEEKLKQFMLSDEEKKQIIHELLNSKYFDDERYTESFVFSKVAYNRWGKIKIRAALRQKKIPETFINTSLQKIDPEKYSANIRYLIDKKQQELSRKKSDNIRQKTISYLLSSGYELNNILLFI